jgi:hypothetical protein
MKKWKIEVVAEDEKQAAQILRTMSNAFQIAGDHNLPMDSMFFDQKGNKELSTCEIVKP